MSAPELRRCRVRVPGSTSNLGAGFDCLGLAVDRTLTAGFEPEGGRLELRRRGTLAGVGGPADEDLLVRAFRAGLRSLGRPDAGGVLDVHSDIPVGRGLGSSAAALVAGRALAGLAAGGGLDAHAAFRTALDLEGHGDNAAPAAFGGLRAVVGPASAPRVLELELADAVGFAFAAPPGTVSTREAREALPADVPFGTAAETIWRVVALIRGLAEADGDLLARGLADRLHAPHRMALIPGAEAAVAAARDAGAWGVTVSGAGSGLLALGPSGEERRLAEALAEGLARGLAGAAGGPRGAAGAAGEAGILFLPLRPVPDGVRAADADG